MKVTTSIKRAVTVASLSIAGLLLPASVHASQLTYDLRILSSSDGSPIVNAHNVSNLPAGDVLTVGLFAIIHGTDATHTNDGFTNGAGTFLSTGSLLGDFRGDLTGDTASQINNMVNFTGPTAQSGFMADLDADGDMDVGSKLTTGNGIATLPWFKAVSVNGSGSSPVFGTGAGAGDTEFLIGQTLFTISATAQPGQTVSLQFAPRVRTDGGIIATHQHFFTIDGSVKTLTGTDVNIDEIGASVSTIPEPSAIGMLLLGSIGLVGFRRSAIRRMIA